MLMQQSFKISTMKHWGDLPAVGDTDSAFAKMEREQLTKLRPMDVQGPRLYQTCSRQYSTTAKPSPQEKFQVDPITLHTIKLIQHARKMRNLIQQVTLQHENAKPDTEITFPATLPVPEYNGPDIRPRVQQPFCQVLRGRDSNFARGIGTAPPVIDSVSGRKLMRCSVAAICAHIGFDTSKESSLEFLTDLLQEFYLRTTKHLRSAVDNQLLLGNSGFPDVIEQVFSECGIGSITDLDDFYQNRVIRYHENMLQQSQQLVMEYEKLKVTGEQKPAETFTLIRIKDSPSTDIQFPELEEKDVAETEQLLQLKGIGAYEITVEQESVTGLTTDIDSKIATNVKTENDNRLYLDDDGSSMIRDSSQQSMESLTESNNHLSFSDILPPLVNARTNKSKKLLHFLDDEETGSLKTQDHPWSRQPSKQAHNNSAAPNSNLSALLPPPNLSASPAKKMKLEESVDPNALNASRLQRRQHSDQHDENRNSIPTTSNSAVTSHMTHSHIPARSSKKHKMPSYTDDDESSITPREAKRIKQEDVSTDNSAPLTLGPAKSSKSKRMKKM